MRKTKNNLEILLPNEQLNLYGFDSLFDFFVRLFENKTFPNVSLISGQKGIGKTTFIYHFVNYLLSKEEKNSYLLEKKEISKENQSFKLLSSNIHPNFFALKKATGKKSISIEDARNLLNFLNKTTFKNNRRFVLIDSEYLNINSSNSLLKSLEETSHNTFFFIITNNTRKIFPTIKSRSLEFNFFLNFKTKKEIFLNLSKLYNLENLDKKILSQLYYDSPGNLIKYYPFIDFSDLENRHIIEDNINSLIDLYYKNPSLEILSFISLFIEKFYTILIFKSKFQLNKYFYNKFQILKKIDELKTYNLDSKNIFFYIQNIVKNET